MTTQKVCAQCFLLLCTIPAISLAIGHALPQDNFDKPEDTGSRQLNLKGLPTSVDFDQIPAIASGIYQEFVGQSANSWNELKEVSNMAAMSDALRSRLGAFDRNTVGRALRDIAIETRTNPPKSWHDLEEILEKHTSVLPPELLQSYIGQKIAEALARRDVGTPAVIPGVHRRMGSTPEALRGSDSAVAQTASSLSTILRSINDQRSSFSQPLQQLRSAMPRNVSSVSSWMATRSMPESGSSAPILTTKPPRNLTSAYESSYIDPSTRTYSVMTTPSSQRTLFGYRPSARSAKRLLTPSNDYSPTTGQISLTSFSGERPTEPPKSLNTFPYLNKRLLKKQSYRKRPNQTPFSRTSQGTTVDTQSLGGAGLTDGASTTEVTFREQQIASRLLQLLSSSPGRDTPVPAMATESNPSDASESSKLGLLDHLGLTDLNEVAQKIGAYNRKALPYYRAALALAWATTIIYLVYVFGRLYHWNGSQRFPLMTKTSRIVGNHPEGL